MKQTIENGDIQIAHSFEQICKCFKIMRQLRPHFVEEQAFVEQVERQINEGYNLAYSQDEEGIKALIGFRFLEFLALGKVLYIDDLVTDGEARKSGHGSMLLKWVLEKAQNAGCHQVHLDSGPQRHEAHKLYLNHGFKIIAHHFSLELKK